MFARFSDRARSAVVEAQADARELGHTHIGTEHLLLGLLRVQDGSAAAVLESLGVRHETVRARVVERLGISEATPPSKMPFDPETKQAFELALREALAMGHNQIGTEHLLLALVRVKDGAAAAILDELEIDADRLRTAVNQERTPATLRASAAMLRRGFEYHVEHCDEVLVKRLNQLGREGWELVAVTQAERYQLVFKRKR